MKLELNENIMDVNNGYAAKNRGLFAEDRVLAVNIIGSPGAGKTTLLERLLKILADDIRIAVIEGDLATAKDAQRIAAIGCEVVQINTDGGCHLDAKMINKVLPAFDLPDTDLLIIENVGNLVCPTGFDLGEDLRMVVMSVTEGTDKPSKYPATFLAANYLAVNKVDLLEYTDFDMDQAVSDVREINPAIKIFPTGCRNGYLSGLKELAAAILAEVKEKRNTDD